jgi:quercetin dioxygenase-like cupin family protein
MSLTLVEDPQKDLKPETQQASSNDSISAVGGTGDADGSFAAWTHGQVQYVPSGTGRSYKSPIDEVAVLLTGEQTGGKLFMAEATVPPGCGNLPHIHDREDETFYLHQGTLSIQVGDKALLASPGDVVQLPRGVMHCFQNTGNVNAKFLIVAAPAGLEKFFEEGFYPAVDWPNAMPPMNDEFMGRVMTAAAKCGLTFLPPA